MRLICCDSDKAMTERGNDTVKITARNFNDFAGRKMVIEPERNYLMNVLFKLSLSDRIHWSICASDPGAVKSCGFQCYGCDVNVMAAISQFFNSISGLNSICGGPSSIFRMKKNSNLIRSQSTQNCLSNWNDIIATSGFHDTTEKQPLPSSKFWNWILYRSRLSTIFRQNTNVFFSPNKSSTKHPNFEVEP